MAIGIADTAEVDNWGLFDLLDWPAWLEIVLSIVILDMLIYWQHVASHLIPALWSIHQAHHMDRDFDATSGGFTMGVSVRTAGPPERIGLKLEPGLVEQLIVDTDHSDALPLLAYCLNKLHLKKSGPTCLSISDYNRLFTMIINGGSNPECSGISAAIAQTADRILSEYATDKYLIEKSKKAFYALSVIEDDIKLQKDKRIGMTGTAS